LTSDVLVVDDEDVVRDLILEILRRASIGAVGVVSAYEARRFLAMDEVRLSCATWSCQE
jgi:DNA-binding NtrC family response regulator